MFIATLGIAISVTISAVYLTFYSISVKLRDLLEIINMQGIVFMTYLLVFVLIGTEWAPRQPLGFYFLFFTVILLLSSVVLLQYPKLRLAMIITAISYTALIIIIDLFLAN